MQSRIDAPPTPDRLNLRVLRFRNDPLRDDPAMLAQELLATSRFEEALELTAASLDEDPTDADLLLTHGVALAYLGQLNFAQRALMRAAEAEPDWAEPWRHLANVLLRRGRPEQALLVIERARALKADDTDADEALDAMEQEASLEMRARRYIAGASLEEPTMLAHELLAAGRADEAFEVTRTALVDELDDEDLLVTHARAARDRGDLDEALSVLQTASVAAPDWTEVWRLLAEIHEERGDLERAREAASRGLSVDPADGPLRALQRRLETPRAKGTR